MTNYNPRKLTDNEISYLRFGKLADPYTWIVLEIKTKIRQKTLLATSKTAFRKTLDYFDELNTVVRGRKYVYQKNAAKVTTVKCNFDGYNLDKLVKRLNGTEPIQLYVVDEHYLVFKFSHTHIDGTGATMLIDAFLCYLCGKKAPLKTNSYVGDLEFIKDLKTYKQSRGISFKNHLAEKAKSKKQKIYRKRLVIEKNVPFLMGKIIAVMSQYFTNDELTFMIPSNIRNYHPETVSVSNLTEILYLDCKKSDNWLTISKKIHNGIANCENLNVKNINYGLIIDLPPMFRGLTQVAAKIGQKRGKFLTAGSITSITHHFEKYCNDKISIESVFMVPFYQPLLPYTITIFEAKGKTNVVFCSDERYVSSKTADAILAEVGKIK